MLNPHLVLFFGLLSTSHQQCVRSRSTPFERTGVVVVEFAQPPSRPLLRSTLAISPTTRSIIFNTFREDKSGGCRVCSTPISSSSSVYSRHPTNGAFDHVQHPSRGREWWLSSLLDPHLDLFFGPLLPSHQQHVRSYSTPFKRTRVAAVEFARPPSHPLLRSTLDIPPTARSITFNTLREDKSGGCRVCSTPISSSSSVHSRHLTNNTFDHIQHLSRGREWWLLSLLDPHLILFFGPLSTSHQWRVRSRSTPFERMGVAAVEIARPPSRPLLRSTLAISPTTCSIIFNTFREDESGGCRVCSTPISSSPSVYSRHPTNGAFNHTSFERTGVAAVEFAQLPSHSLLWLILDIPPAVHSIMFNTLGEDGSGGCRVRLAPTLFSSSVDSQVARSIEFNTWKTGMAAMATATLFHFASTPAYQH